MLASMGLPTGIDMQRLLALRAKVADWLEGEALHRAVIKEVLDVGIAVLRGEHQEGAALPRSQVRPVVVVAREHHPVGLGGVEDVARSVAEVRRWREHVETGRGLDGQERAQRGVGRVAVVVEPLAPGAVGKDEVERLHHVFELRLQEGESLFGHRIVALQRERGGAQGKGVAVPAVVEGAPRAALRHLLPHLRGPWRPGSAPSPWHPGARGTSRRPGPSGRAGSGWNSASALRPAFPEWRKAPARGRSRPGRSGLRPWPPRSGPARARSGQHAARRLPRPGP